MRILLILFFVVLFSENFAATGNSGFDLVGVVNGSPTGTLSTRATYWFDDGNTYCPTWNITSSRGFVVSQTTTGTRYEVVIEWTSTGTTSVQFIDDCDAIIVATKSVTISGTCTTPSTPSVTFTVSSNTCGNKTITYTGTPPVGVTWYWQTTSTGTSTANSTNSFTATASGTYYVRAKKNCGNTWSTSSAATSAITVNAIPAVPAVPLVSSNTCGPRTLTKNGTAPAGVTWYWQGTTPNGQDNTSATATATTYSATTHGTYYFSTMVPQNFYIAARNNTSGCWSQTAVVSVTVDNPPTPPNSSNTFCDMDAMSITSTGFYETGYDVLPWTNLNNNFKWYNASEQLLASGTNYSPVNLNPGVHTFKVKSVSGTGLCESQNFGTVTVTVNTACDDNLNWAQSIAYGMNPDGSPKEIGSSKIYADGMGNLIQSQVKAYSTNQVFASQPVYDMDGSQTLSSLPAPINASEFGYRHRFMTNASGARYSASDFDTPASLNNPTAVGNNGQGTLGWYYSTSNTQEPNTPTTAFPFVRSWTEHKPNPTSSISSGAGESFRMGSGHEAKSDRMTFTRGELSHYYSLQNHFVTSTLSSDVNLISNSEATTTTGFIANNSVLISAVTQGSQTYVRVEAMQPTSTPGVWPIEETKVVVPGKSYKFRVKGYRTGTGNAYLFVKNAITNSNIVWPGALLPLGVSNEAWVETTFTAPAGCTAISLGVLFSGQAMNDVFYVNTLSLTEVVNMDNVIHGYKILSTAPDGKRSMTFVDADGKTLASALVTSQGGSPYSYNYWTYQYYNDLGQLVASVAPNGVNTSSTAYPSFVSLYKYDHLGRLIEASSTDEGTSRFIYSNDGKIRFSQNQVQRDAVPPRFSYTNYDYLGRVIESGEYASLTAASVAFVFEPSTVSSPNPNSVLLLVDNVGHTGVTLVGATGSDALRFKDVSFITYDASVEFTSDALHPQQNNLRGQISRTRNEQSTTWYSYDEFGQLEWTVQEVSGLGRKTVDYSYDYLGNVTQVTYQKNQPDAFYHHYTYDADQRLIQVETSKDGSTKMLQAKYYYYLHGPLKRVELAGDKQGIDYVYTLQGELKGINHADPAMDPGQDGMSGAHASFAGDVFGMNLHYFNSDYSGAGYAAGNLTTGASFPDQFSGLPKAVSWNSPVDQNQKRVYGFQYDARNQLVNSQWGNMTGTAGTYGTTYTEAQREQVSGYDKNGNIQAMLRKGKEAQLTANYAYQYEANTNKLDKVTENGAPVVDYSYNTIGQMVRQQEDYRALDVEYNVAGLVEKVYSSVGGGESTGDWPTGWSTEGNSLNMFDNLGEAGTSPVTNEGVEPSILEDGLYQASQRVFKAIQIASGDSYVVDYAFHVPDQFDPVYECSLYLVLWNGNSRTYLPMTTFQGEQLYSGTFEFVAAGNFDKAGFVIVHQQQKSYFVNIDDFLVKKKISANDITGAWSSGWSQEGSSLNDFPPLGTTTSVFNEGSEPTVMEDGLSQATKRVFKTAQVLNNVTYKVDYSFEITDSSNPTSPGSLYLVLWNGSNRTYLPITGFNGDNVYDGSFTFLATADFDKVGFVFIHAHQKNYFVIVNNFNVRAISSLAVSYHYDDRGDLVKKTYYDGGAPAKNVFYVNDAAGSLMAMYEQNLPSGSAQLSEVPVYGATRLAVYKPGSNVYFYELGDHLGNVRAVIGVPETDTYSTTLENSTQTADQSTFKNYSRSDFDLFDHTDAGTTYSFAQLLNGGNNSQVGLAKSLKVSPGDVITVDAYAKYANAGSTPSNLAGFAAALTSAFGVSGTSTGEDGLRYDALNSYGSLVASGMGAGDSQFGPKAFITILLFDNNYTFVDAAWVQLDGSYVQTGSTKAPHFHMTQQKTVEEAGYALVFLSNENPTQVDVYFDDFSIQHQHSVVVAGSDFYPFGLTMDTREINDEYYRYGYQGQYAEKDTLTGWNEFELRMYDARFGRWLSPDPYGQFASPFVAMGNVPNMGTDPDGGWCPWCWDMIRETVKMVLNEVIFMAPESTLASTIAGGSVASAIGTGVMPSPVKIDLEMRGMEISGGNSGPGYNVPRPSYDNPLMPDVSQLNSPLSVSSQVRAVPQPIASGPTGCVSCSIWHTVYRNLKRGLSKGYGTIVSTYSNAYRDVSGEVIVPAVVTVDANYGVAFPIGASYTFTLNWIVQGESRGFYPTTTWYGVDSRGAEIGFGLNLGYWNYHGNGSVLPSDLAGPARSLSFGDGLFGMNANYGYLDLSTPVYKPILSGNSLGVGVQLGGAYWVGETWSGWSFKK